LFFSVNFNLPVHTFSLVNGYMDMQRVEKISITSVI
jgi:hypothetical protein